MSGGQQGASGAALAGGDASTATGLQTRGQAGATVSSASTLQHASSSSALTHERSSARFGTIEITEDIDEEDDEEVVLVPSSAVSKPQNAQRDASFLRQRQEEEDEAFFYKYVWRHGL